MQFNVTVNGDKFDDITVCKVWAMGREVPGEHPDFVRQDKCGVQIKWEQYAQSGEFGWEIDHVKPRAKGGGDELMNLQPLHWLNNRAKEDSWPAWTCSVGRVGETVRE